jgi:hypothetical protein
VPLRNTRVIHPRWRERHEPAVLGGMTARVRLSKPATLGVRNATTGATATVPAARYYQGPGRVQARGGAGNAGSLAEREVDTAPYLVAVPIDLPGGVLPERGDLVDVLDADDPALVGARLYVTEVPTASIVLQRNLGCDLHPPTTPGG